LSSPASDLLATSWMVLNLDFRLACLVGWLASTIPQLWWYYSKAPVQKQFITIDFRLTSNISQQTLTYQQSESSTEFQIY